MGIIQKYVVENCEEETTKLWIYSFGFIAVQRILYNCYFLHSGKECRAEVLSILIMYFKILLGSLHDYACTNPYKHTQQS